jgi:hypothetical protein
LAQRQRNPEAWFELHRWEPGKPWFSPEYIAWMGQLKCPVYMQGPVAAVPASTAFPVEAILEKYAPFAAYFMTSTLSYMVALAMLSGADEIGLWGVDMSATEEWEFQRSGCHFWLCMAEHMGIKVTLPLESDMLRPPPLYGICEGDHMHVKLTVREAELVARINALDQTIQSSVNEKMFLLGAKENNTYQRKTWVSDRRAIDLGVQGAPRPPLPAENKDEALAKVAEALAGGEGGEQMAVTAGLDGIIPSGVRGDADAAGGAAGPTPV